MSEFRIGGFAKAKAGHHTGKCYVIFQMDSEYVYLVDGRIRTTDRPKKKKKMHVNMLVHSDETLVEKVINQSVKNEEIKRAIKLLQSGNSIKEAT
jgi:ribosomal protein L14E/L6E/L27E